MEEKLISLETAKLAKEKGFDWEVTNYFKIGQLNQKIIEEKCISCSINIKFSEQQLFSRPTQSLLQKWLRKNHNIRINICDNSVIGSREIPSKLPKYNSSINTETGTFFHWQFINRDIDRTDYELILEKTLYKSLLLIPEKS